MNKINIADYLDDLGIKPAKRRGNKLLYSSPLHDERTPSFEVNLRKNAWYDFGIGKGGGLIAFIMEYNNINLEDAIKKVKSNDRTINSFEKKYPSKYQISDEPDIPAIKDIKVSPLTNYVLINYFKERGINENIAKKECMEITYTSTKNDKQYFSACFVNDNGGYETRNKFLKTCVNKKDVTTKLNSASTVRIFEGFMDYLSYLTIKELRQKTEKAEGLPINDKKYDYIILNSITSISKVIDKIGDYKEIQCYLDNDKAGQCTFGVIKDKHGDKAKDMSSHYQGYNDVNDFLVEKILGKTVQNQQNKEKKVHKKIKM
jgi:DNA primase